MAIYKLTIYQNRKLLGHFVSDTPHSQQAVSTLAAALSAEHGFHFELQVARSERRLLQADTNGVHVLAREPHYEPCDLHTLES